MSKLGDVIMRGLHSAIPAAGTEGRLYYETDTNKLFRDNGSSWDDCEGTGSTPSTVVKSAKAYRTSNQSINDSSETLMTFDAEEWDNDTIHDTGSNTGRLTCKTDGIYQVTATIRWDTNTNGGRQIRIKKISGVTTTVVAALNFAATGYNSETLTALVSLAANDYLELYAYQTSGGALNVYYSSDQPASFGMVMVGTLS